MRDHQRVKIVIRLIRHGKKAKLDLLQRYGIFRSTPEREIQQYHCIGVLTDNPFSWWSSQLET